MLARRVECEYIHTIRVCVCMYVCVCVCMFAVEVSARRVEYRVL